MRLARSLLAVAALASGCAERETLTSCPPSDRQLSAGASALLPTSVWDDGNRTYLAFAGNTMIPPVTVVDRAGVERPASYTVEPGGVVMLHETAPEIRLRDGKEVACIRNGSWSPYGLPTGTGTMSPDVVRLPRSSGS